MKDVEEESGVLDLKTTGLYSKYYGPEDKLIVNDLSNATLSLFTREVIPFKSGCKAEEKQELYLSIKNKTEGLFKQKKEYDNESLQ